MDSIPEFTVLARSLPGLVLRMLSTYNISNYYAKYLAFIAQINIK